MIEKPSYTSGTTIIYVPYDQDNPNDKNRQNGAIRYNSVQSRRFERNRKGLNSLTTELDQKGYIAYNVSNRDN